MKHPAAKSLSSEEATKIYNLTREIMSKENIAGIPLNIKSSVWKTSYSYNRMRIGPTAVKIKDERIQLGGYMLTGSLYPHRIYYISLYDPEYHIHILKNQREIMLATIVSSVILEEIAHAVNCRRTGWTKETGGHGPEFLLVFRELWRKHFILFQYALQDIYGSEGYLGEELL